MQFLFTITVLRAPIRIIEVLQRTGRDWEIAGHCVDIIQHPGMYKKLGGSLRNLLQKLIYIEFH
jgi:hypothetical protein